MQFKKVLGLILIFAGIIFLLNSSLVITGFVISEKIGGSFSFIAGFVLLAVGVVGLTEKESGIESLVKELNVKRVNTSLPRIVSSSRFERTARRAPSERLIEALRKIGTGQGKEEKLRTGQYSIRVTGRDRVIFEYKDGHRTAELVEYSEHYHP